VAGGNTQIQYNNGAGFAADGNLVCNYSSRVLTVTGSSVITGNANVGNLNATGTVTASILVSNIANGTAPLTVTSTTKVANLNVDLLDGYDTATAATANTVVVRNADGNITGNNISGTLSTAAQPNITSVGTLTSLAVTGNITGANVTTSSYVIRSVGTAISAAGTIQGDATALTKDINVVSTVSAGQGVRLPTAVAGMVIIINNTSATNMNVYPATGAAINSLATNAAYTHIPTASLQYYAISATQWYTIGATYS
jgi:hypothetical protein